jgi:protein-disulfide isomerase
MTNKKVFIISLTMVLISFIILALWYTQKENSRVTEVAQTNLFRETAMILGPREAPVTVVEFFDPECESCRAFHPLVKMLLEEFKDKVQVHFRYAAFHGNSAFAIKILEASRQQNKYWEVLDVLYQYQPQWGDHHNPRPELIWTYLDGLDLDIVALKNDMTNIDIEKIIQQDAADGASLGVRMTPSFFVNGEPLTSFGYQQLRELVMKNL